MAIEKELQAETWTLERLEELLELARSIKDWKSHSYDFTFNYFSQRNVWGLGNPKYLTIVLEILKIITQDRNTAHHIWHYLHPCAKNQLSWGVLEILYICAEAGAKPTDQQINELLFWTKRYTRNESWAIAFLKMFVAVSKMNSVILGKSLNFLAEYYQVSAKFIELSTRLVHNVYDCLEKCLASKNLIHCFLYIIDEEFTFSEQFVETSFSKIWAIDKDDRMSDGLPDYYNFLQRSLLHMAAIFPNALKHLPPKMIEKYMGQRDCHGCTPLHVAYLHHNREAIDCLIQHGGDEDIIDLFGYKPKQLSGHFPGDNCDGEISEIVKDPDLSSIRTKQPEQTSVCSDTSSYQSMKQTDHPKVRFTKACHEVMEAKTGILNKMKPLMVMPENDAIQLREQLELVFGRLVRQCRLRLYDPEAGVSNYIDEETNNKIFKELATIKMAGSMRERLKSGQLDEGDLQLRFPGYYDNK